MTPQHIPDSMLRRHAEYLSVVQQWQQLTQTDPVQVAQHTLSNSPDYQYYLKCCQWISFYNHRYLGEPCPHIQYLETWI